MLFFQLILQISLIWLPFCQSIGPRDGRYSYSLTTFDPSGKLGQVESAIEATKQGIPIVAVIVNNSYIDDNNTTSPCYGIIMVAPQILPDIYALDDGTTRFSLITPEIMVSHTGLSSDGRVIVAAAQRMAVRHEYTFDEHIDIAIFLEELSLLYQEYTMKAASRPFGASIIVAFVPKRNILNNKDPMLYRIDPSGNIESLGKYCVVQDQLDTTDLLPSLRKLIAPDDASSTSLSLSSMKIEDIRMKIVELLRLSMNQQAAKQQNEDFIDDITILSATLFQDNIKGRTFYKDRHEPDMLTHLSSDH